MKKISNNKAQKLWDMRKSYRKRVIIPPDELNGRPIQLQITEIEPGDTVENHHHIVQTEVLFILSGRGIFMGGGFQFNVSPEDVFIVAPGETHSATATGLTALRFLTIKLDYLNGDNDTVWE